MPLDREFFAAPALEVARRLIGVTLAYGDCAGEIVETEAYSGDEASHFVTRRHTGALMGDTYASVYVYSIYGMHRCLNFTADRSGPGAVLIRALRPVRGIDAMRQRRGVTHDHQVASGPAKLVVALDLPDGLTGRDVTDVFRLEPPTEAHDIESGPRIGISKARDLPWRFHVRGSPFVSRRR